MSSSSASCLNLIKITLVGTAMALPWTSNAQPKQITQALTIQQGWNLVTFRVLPTTRTPEAVLGSVISTDGTRSALYGPEAGHPLVAIFHIRKLSTGYVYEKFPTSANTMPPPLPKLAPQIDSSTIGSISSIDYGEAYFIKVQSVSADASFTLSGLPPPFNWQLNVDAGFTVLGIPGAFPLSDITTGSSRNQPLNVLSVFRSSDLQSISYIARWDAKNQVYQYYDPREPERAGFQVLDTGLGHWFNATQALILKPEMVVEAPGDQDNPPFASPGVQVGQQWLPGPEDISVGIPGQPAVFHDKSTQTTLYISKSDNSLLLPLYNRGGGLLSWQATLIPFTGQVPQGVYILNDDALKASLALTRPNSDVQPDTLLQGVTATEPDGIQIIVHRRRLHPGAYLATLKIEFPTGGVNSGQTQTKQFNLVIDVGGMDGRWKGFASIDTVNGKTTSIPDIDLVLQLYTDGLPGSHMIRGIIDSQEALLWPVDGQILGHIAEDPVGGFSPQYSGKFVLSGGYTLPPGDVNHFPYGSFPSPTSATQADPDTGLAFTTNAEGDRFYVGLADRVRNGGEVLPNFTNPIPRFISREFELVGELAARDDAGTPVVEGQYSEVIRGLLPDAVRLNGKFRLTREAATAFERRPIKAPLRIYNSGRPVTISQPFGTNPGETITILQHVLIDRIVVVLAHDLPDNKLVVTLDGPNGKKVTLHSGQRVGSISRVIFDSAESPSNPIQFLSPPEYSGSAAALNTQQNRGRSDAALQETIGQYSIRRPRESLVTAFRDADAYGDWKLTVSTLDNSVQGNVLGWTLLVYGAPIGTVEGDVVVDGDSESNRFSDVDVHVLGLNAELAKAFTKFDRTTGHFSIAFLPSIRVEITASKPGFPPAGIDSLNCPADPRRYRDKLYGIVPGDSILQSQAPPTYKLVLRQEVISTCDH